MSWCRILGTHAISFCATKQEGNGRAIGKTFEKTTPEHLKLSAHVRVNGKMTSAGGEPRMHVSQPSGGKSEAMQLEKKLIGRKLYHAMSFVGRDTAPSFRSGPISEGHLLAIPILPYPAAYGFPAIMRQR